MVRLAVRKTPSKSRFSLRTAAATKHRRAPVKRAASKAATKPTNTKVIVPKIKILMYDMSTFAQNRKANYGTNDRIAKRLQTIHTALKRELRKTNAINPNLAKHLININPALRGVASAKAISVRTQVPKLGKIIKENVQKDVIKFINTMKTSLAPLYNEFKRLEMQLNNNIKMAKRGKYQLKTDPALKRKFISMQSNISHFKTRWFQRLNKLNLHGNKNVQNSVNQLKKQLDDLANCSKRCLTIINRYSKPSSLKPGHKWHHILTSAQTKAFETRFSNIKADLEYLRTKVELYFDQLKAVRLF